MDRGEPRRAGELQAHARRAVKAPGRGRRPRAPVPDGLDRYRVSRVAARASLPVAVPASLLVAMPASLRSARQRDDLLIGGPVGGREPGLDQSGYEAGRALVDAPGRRARPKLLDQIGPSGTDPRPQRPGASGHVPAAAVAHGVGREDAAPQLRLEVLIDVGGIAAE